MSTFWDSIDKDVKVYGSNKTSKGSKSVYVNPPQKVDSSFWDSINAEVKVNPNPTLQTSYNKAKQSIKPLKDACKVSDGKGGFKDNHHFVIPTGARKVIGQCSKCKGERWFNNYLETTFNGRTKVDQSTAQTDAEQDMEVQGTPVVGVA